MSGETFLKKRNVKVDCDQIVYRWKEDDTLIDGMYKLNFKGRMTSMKYCSKGVLKKSINFFKGKKINETIYTKSGNYITTIYSKERSLSIPSFDPSYDSAIYNFENHFLQKINYYKEGREFQTIINYQPGKIDVKSVTDQIDILELSSNNWDTECPYDILMKDPETGEFFDEIEINVEEPDGKYHYYYALKDGRYQWEVK